MSLYFIIGFLFSLGWICVEFSQGDKLYKEGSLLWRGFCVLTIILVLTIGWAIIAGVWTCTIQRNSHKLDNKKITNK